MVWLATWKVFEYLVLMSIVINSVSLGCYDYSDRAGITVRNQILSRIQLFFSVLFSIECLIKIIAVGFITHPKAYLRDGWNIIDFFVVVTGAMELIPGSVSLKALRTIRVIRPLRSINAIPSMRRVVTTLINSLPNFANVAAFMLFFLVLFASMGLHLYSGELYNRCRLTPRPVNATDWPADLENLRVCGGGYQCPEHQYCSNPLQYEFSIEQDGIHENNPRINYGVSGFDNIFQGILTIFHVITMDSWSVIMYDMMDAAQPLVAGTFFCSVVILGAFFLIKLILAVIMNSYQRLQQEELKAQLQDNPNIIVQNIENAIKLQIAIENDEEIVTEIFIKDGNIESKEEEEEKLDIQEEEVIVNEDEIKLEDIYGSSTAMDRSSSKNIPYPSGVFKIHDFSDVKSPFKDNVPFEISHIEDSQQIIELESPHYFLQNKKKQQQIQVQQTMARKLKLKEERDNDKEQTNTIESNNNKMAALCLNRTVVADAGRFPNEEDGLQGYYLENKAKNGNIDALERLKALQRKEQNDRYRLKSIQIYLGVLDRAKTNKLYAYFLQISESTWFQMTITSLILLNTLAFAWDRHPISQQEVKILEFLNLVFSIIFTGEMIVKLIGLGFKGYFLDMFNAFDGFLVVLSLIDNMMTYVIKSEVSLNASDLLAFRAFRLLRVFRLAKTWESLYNLLKTISRTIKDVSNFSILLFLLIFTYSLLGMEVFAYNIKFDKDGEVDKENGTYPDSNFNYFLEAMASVFIVLANDGWSKIFFDHFRSGYQEISIFFFVSLLIVGQYFLLNLFLAVLLQNFDEDSFDQDKLKKELEIRLKTKRRSKCTIVQNKLKKFFNVDQKTKKIPKKKKSIKEGSLAHNFLNKMAKKEIKTNDILIEGKSLFLFTDRSYLRRFTYSIANSKLFEAIIMTCIIISTIQLAMDTPIIDPESVLAQVLFYVDISTSAIFVIEAIIKIISYGFMMNGSSSYLRSWQNFVDFIIVVVSLVSLFANNKSNFSIFKIMRGLKVVRPLRLISRNKGLVIAIQALIQGIPAIANVAVVSGLFYLVFGIVGVTFFKGTYYDCQLGHIEFIATNVVTKWDCLSQGGIWYSKMTTFDNVYNSVQTLFQMSTTAGWAEIMYTGMATTNIDQALVPKNKPAIAFFFIAFMIVGSFFILNLFVGVIISTFNREKENLGKSFLLSDEQKQWLEMKLLIHRVRPKKKYKEHNSKVRQFIFKIASSNWFEIVIMTCIIINTVVLCFKWYGEPDQVTQVTEILNYIFSGIFTLEAILKIVALGSRYFKDNWNAFDFFVVLGTIIGIIVNLMSDVSIGRQTAILRSFRIFRIFRLINRAKSLQMIFATIVVSLPALINVGSLLLLLLFLYSVLGVFLFAEVQIAPPLSDYVNFQNFGYAFLGLIRIATGDAWHEILYGIGRHNSILFQCTKQAFTYEAYQANDNQMYSCGSMLAFPYIFSYLLIISQVFLNLFIAIVLQGFADTNIKENRKFNNEMSEFFKDKWADFDEEGTGFIHIRQLHQILWELGDDLGWDESYRDDLEKQDMFIADLDLPVYNNFTNYNFIDLLEALSRNFLIKDTIKQAKGNSELKAKLECDIDGLKDGAGVEALDRVKAQEKASDRKKSKKKDMYTSRHERALVLMTRQFKVLLQKRKLAKIEEERKANHRDCDVQTSFELLYPLMPLLQDRMKLDRGGSSTADDPKDSLEKEIQGAIQDYRNDRLKAGLPAKLTEESEEDKKENEGGENFYGILSDMDDSMDIGFRSNISKKYKIKRKQPQSEGAKYSPTEEDEIKQLEEEIWNMGK